MLLVILKINFYRCGEVLRIIVNVGRFITTSIFGNGKVENNVILYR